MDKHANTSGCLPNNWTLGHHEIPFSLASCLLALAIASITFGLAPFMISMGKIAKSTPAPMKITPVKAVPVFKTENIQSKQANTKTVQQNSIQQPVFSPSPILHAPSPSISLDLKFFPVLTTGLQLPASLAKPGGKPLLFAIPETAQAPKAGRNANEIPAMEAPAIPSSVFEGKPQYPPVARLRNIEGYVVVQFEVLLDGKIGAITILESNPGDIFVESTIDWLNTLQFPQAIHQNQSYKYVVQRRIVFKLD